MTHAFRAQNLPTAAWEPSWLWSLKLLELNDALTLLIGILGLLAVRQQVALGTKPHLGYEGRKNEESETALEPGEVWTVALKNSGSGVAIVERQTFRMYLLGDASPDERFLLSHDQVVEQLKARGLVHGRDYALTRYSGSATIAANTKELLLEILIEKSLPIIALDMRLEFRGVLRDRFERTFFLIPRNQIHLAGR